MKSPRPTVTLVHWASLLIAVLTLVGSIRSARAAVRLEGDWTGDDHRVTLDADATSRAHALDLLAEAAGWSVVVRAPLRDEVHLHVKDQSARDVLSILLSDHDYIARRAGNLVSIETVDRASTQTPAAASAAPPPAPPPLPSGVVKRGEDHAVFGGKMTIARTDVAHDVAVYGGKLDVYGTVTGDLVVIGGSAHVHDGAKVTGEATVIGGHMEIDDDADVAREVSVVGGHLDRATRAKGAKAAANLLDESRHDDEQGSGGRPWQSVRRWMDDAASSLSASALLFVFGAVVVALGTERSRALRVEIAARPMQTFALGVVGCIAAVGIFVALCVTIIGIPVALFGLVVFVLAAYVGVSAVLTTAGEALLRHRTESPYAHLALGCALFFLVGLLPWVGKWATVIVVLVGIGVIVATRAAGLVKTGRGGNAPTMMGYR
jgi:hypothetical protein